ERGDETAAWLDVNAALALDPRSVEARIAEIGLLMAHAKTEEALRGVDELLQIDPRCRTAYYIRWRLYLATGRLEDALTAAKGMLALAPGDPAALGAVADVDRALGRFAEARDLYTRIIESRSDAGEAWLGRAQ